MPNARSDWETLYNAEIHLQPSLKVSTPLAHTTSSWTLPRRLPITRSLLLLDCWWTCNQATIMNKTWQRNWSFRGLSARF